MLRSLLITSLFCLFFLSIHAQEIQNLRAELVGDSVRIDYYLDDPLDVRTYRVSLKGIVEGDTVELTQLSGSVGDSILPGEHVVWWDFVPEMERFRGSVSFHLQALPDFYISAPDSGLNLKRGRPLNIRWYGGNAQFDSLTLELYQYDAKLDSIDFIAGGTEYTWKIPNNIKPDDGYRVKISGTNETEVSGFTPPFSVKRQFSPYLIYGPPLLLVSGLVVGFINNWWILPEPPEDGGRGIRGLPTDTGTN